MLLAALIPVAVSPPGETWRYHGEVRALLAYRGGVVAATAGGVLHRTGQSWLPLGENAPPGLVGLESRGGRLAGLSRDGASFSFGGGRWRRERIRVAGTRASEAASDAPPPGSQGAFLSASTPDGSVRSFWGDSHLWRREAAVWRRWIARPPAEGDYALLPIGDRLWAGTPQGIFAWDGQAWIKEPLPEAMPLARPHGLARVGDRWLIGGLQGLWMGAPGAWEEVDRSPVRQILQDGDAIWVLFGNGALDKLELKRNRRHPDVLHGATRRPWGSCLALGAGGLLIGGEGGWIEKRGEALIERYPPELRGQVVTALAAAGETRFVGTQKGGLFVFNGAKVRAYNPGNGLRDPWVTALATSPTRGLILGTASAGLYTLRSGRLGVFASPTSRPRQIFSRSGRLIVGGMDGAWAYSGGGWRPLPIDAEETTAVIQVGGRMAVVTASGVHFLR